jgi:hypothetical protein
LAATAVAALQFGAGEPLKRRGKIGSLELRNFSQESMDFPSRQIGDRVQNKIGNSARLRQRKRFPLHRRALQKVRTSQKNPERRLAIPQKPSSTWKQ